MTKRLPVVLWNRGDGGPAFRVAQQGDVALDGDGVALLTEYVTQTLRLSSYTDLADAVANIGSDPAILLIDTDTTVSSYTNIPLNITLRFTGQGTITVAGNGYPLLEVRSDIDAKDFTCFSWSGNTDNIRLWGPALPEWFGAKAHNNSTRILRVTDGVTSSTNVLTSATATFISKGAAAGDLIALSVIRGRNVDEGVYTIASVDSETQITINETWPTSGQSGLTCSVFHEAVDSTAAIQKALDCCEYLEFSPGWYITTSTLWVWGQWQYNTGGGGDLTLKGGAARDNTQIYAIYQMGPILHLQNGRINIYNMGFIGSESGDEFNSALQQCQNSYSEMVDVWMRETAGPRFLSNWATFCRYHGLHMHRGAVDAHSPVHNVEDDGFMSPYFLVDGWTNSCTFYDCDTRSYHGQSDSTDLAYTNQAYDPDDTWRIQSDSIEIKSAAIAPATLTTWDISDFDGRVGRMIIPFYENNFVDFTLVTGPGEALEEKTVVVTALTFSNIDRRYVEVVQSIKLPALGADESVLYNENIYLANDLREKYEAHRVLTSSSVHSVADSTNVISAPAATDLATAVTLANELKADFNAHVANTTPHGSAGSTLVTAANATANWSVLRTLLIDIRTQFEAHRVDVSGAPAVHGAADSTNAIEAGYPGSQLVRVISIEVPGDGSTSPGTIQVDYNRSGGRFETAASRWTQCSLEAQWIRPGKAGFRAETNNCDVDNLYFWDLSSYGVAHGIVLENTSPANYGGNTIRGISPPTMGGSATQSTWGTGTTSAVVGDRVLTIPGADFLKRAVRKGNHIVISDTSASAAIITLINDFRTQYIAHIADIGGSHGAADTANTISHGAATTWLTAMSLLEAAEQAFTRHLVVTGSVHTVPDRTNTPVVSTPTDYEPARVLAKLIELKTLFNAHRADSSTWHTGAAGTPAVSAADPTEIPDVGVFYVDEVLSETECVVDRDWWGGNQTITSYRMYCYGAAVLLNQPNNSIALTRTYPQEGGIPSIVISEGVARCGGYIAGLTSGTGAKAVQDLNSDHASASGAGWKTRWGNKILDLAQSNQDQDTPLRGRDFRMYTVTELGGSDYNIGFHAAVHKLERILESRDEGAALYIDDHYKVTSNALDIPANITLVFGPNSRLVSNAYGKVRIRGRIVSLTNDKLFNNYQYNWQLDQPAKPEWFGWFPNDTSHTYYAEATTAIRSCKILEFGTGTYYVAGRLYFSAADNEPRILRGQGADKTTISAFVSMGGYPLIDFEDTVDPVGWEFEDLAFDGGNYAGYAVRSPGQASNFKFRRVKAVNMPNGIQLHGSGHEVVDCDLTCTGTTGVGVYYVQGSGSVETDNLGLTIRNTKVSAPCGIYTDAVRNLLIDNCTISDCVRTGIYLHRESTGSKITNNRFSGNASTGWVFGTPSATIHADIIANGAAANATGSAAIDKTSPHTGLLIANNMTTPGSTMSAASNPTTSGFAFVGAAEGATVRNNTADSGDCPLTLIWSDNRYSVLSDVELANNNGFEVSALNETATYELDTNVVTGLELLAAGQKRYVERYPTVEQAIADLQNGDTLIFPEGEFDVATGGIFLPASLYLGKCSFKGAGPERTKLNFGSTSLVPTLNNWSIQGGGTLTTGQPDPWGGNTAYRLIDSPQANPIRHGVAGSAAKVMRFYVRSDLKLATGTTGATSAGGATFTDSGADFVTAGVAAGDVVHIVDTSNPSNNGWYEITGTPTGTSFTVTENWPDTSGLSNLTYTIYYHQTPYELYFGFGSAYLSLRLDALDGSGGGASASGNVAVSSIRKIRGADGHDWQQVIIRYTDTYTTPAQIYAFGGFEVLLTEPEVFDYYPQALALAGGVDFEMEGMTVDGNHILDYGVQLISSDKVHLRNVHATRFLKAGFFGATINHLVARGCEAHQIGYDRSWLYTEVLDGTGCGFLLSGNNPDEWELQDRSKVDAVGAYISKLGSNGWDGRAYVKTFELTGNGYVEWQMTYANSLACWAGLDTDPDNVAVNTDIDYAVYMTAAGTAGVYEGASPVGVTVKYERFDTFRINRTGTTITFLINGNLIHTSSTPSTGTLYFCVNVYNNLNTLQVTSLNGASWNEGGTVDLQGITATECASDGVQMHGRGKLDGLVAKRNGSHGLSASSFSGQINNVVADNNGRYMTNPRIGYGLVVSLGCKDVQVDGLQGHNNFSGVLGVDVEQAGDSGYAQHDDFISIANVVGHGGYLGAWLNRCNRLQMSNLIFRDVQVHGVSCASEGVTIDNLLVDGCGSYGIGFYQSTNHPWRGGSRVTNARMFNVGVGEYYFGQTGANHIEFTDGRKVSGYLTSTSLELFDSEALDGDKETVSMILEPGTEFEIVIASTAGDSAGNIEVRVSNDESNWSTLGAAVSPGNGATRTVTYSDGKYVRVRFDHTSGSTGTMDVDVTKSGVVADHSQLGESGEAFGWYTATTLLSDLTSSATWTNAIPAGAKDVELVGRITTAITGPTSIEIGDGTDQDMFGAISTLTAGTQILNSDQTASSGLPAAAARDIVVTPVGGSFSAGAIRLTIQYRLTTAPTN
jgi:parallel beta-helix repeat protein